MLQPAAPAEPPPDPGPALCCPRDGRVSPWPEGRSMQGHCLLRRSEEAGGTGNPDPCLRSVADVGSELFLDATEVERSG